MLRSEVCEGLARGESGTGVGGRVRLTPGGARLIPLFVAGRGSADCTGYPLMEDFSMVRRILALGLLCGSHAFAQSAKA